MTTHLITQKSEPPRLGRGRPWLSAIIMKTAIHIIIVALAITSVALAKERWVLQVNVAGKPSLVCELPDGKKISFMSYYIKSDVVSDEVALQFQKDYPALWRTATGSSGNMHNPKILPLRGKFTEVLLRTPSLRNLDKLARESGYKISGASHEKFHFMKRKGRIKVYAVIWLKLEKVVEQGAASDR